MEITNTSSENTAPKGVKNFLDPARIFDQVQIDRGMRIADFGTGSGHFTLEAARRVGETGKVYALDILPQCLESVESQASMASLNNIEAIRVNLEREGGSTLEDGSVQIIIAKDMLFMNEHKDVIIREMARVLAFGGKALLIEWNQEETPIGPPLEKRVAKEDLIRMAHESGFSHEEELSVGDYHYGFSFSKE